MLQFLSDAEDEPLVFPVTVDYRASFADLFVAGDYRYPDPDVTGERFFVPGTGTRTLFFRILEVTGQRRVPSETVLASVKEHQVRPVTFVELLAVCAAIPNLPSADEATVLREIAAFGTVREIGSGDRPNCYVPVVQRFNGRRYLEPHRVDFPWKPGDQFLVAPRDAVQP